LSSIHRNRILCELRSTSTKNTFFLHKFFLLVVKRVTLKSLAWSVLGRALRRRNKCPVLWSVRKATKTMETKQSPTTLTRTNGYN
jgi:hypothetical protein